jgi:hypothetical protein
LSFKRIVPGADEESPAGSGASAGEVAGKVGKMGAEYKSYASALEESGTLDGAFLSRLHKRDLDLLFVFVCRRHQENLEEKVFDVAKAIHEHRLMPLPLAVQRWIERKYPPPLPPSLSRCVSGRPSSSYFFVHSSARVINVFLTFLHWTFIVGSVLPRPTPPRGRVK